MEITKDYFLNYGNNSNHSYNEVYNDFSGIQSCCHLIRNTIPDAVNILVLGSATGLVLEDFYKIGCVPWGIEICEWAYDQTPVQHKPYVFLGDMCEQIDRFKPAAFDLIFSNSLIYLTVEELRPFLRKCRELTKYFHFDSSTEENYSENDHCRKVLKSYRWWNSMFRSAGFVNSKHSKFLWQ